MAQLDKMVEDYGVTVIDASRPIDAVFADLKDQVLGVVEQWARRVFAERASGLLKLSPKRNMRRADILRAEVVTSRLTTRALPPRRRD